MDIKIHRVGLFARQPLTAFGKLLVASFLSAAASSGLLALLIGLPDNIDLLIVTAALLLCGGLMAIGWRWLPLLGTLISGMFLYQISKQPYVTYHLVRPKEGGFEGFVLDLLIIVFVALAFAAGIGASIQNYRPSARQTPRWFTSALAAVGSFVLGAILIAAISQPVSATPAASTGTSGEPTVHLGPGSFLQSSITISKGSKLLLVDDSPALHVFANGSWQNGQPQAEQQQGAPSLNNVQITSGSLEIGPFTTAGTYHIYCSVHQGMTLTVIVQ